VELVFNWDKLQYRPDGKIHLLYRHERMFEEGLIKPGYSVLDVGGWGMLSSRLLQEEVSCLIIDIFSEDQYYPERVKQLPHINADITKDSTVASLTITPFDLVTCFEMLEHCHDQVAAINNIHSVLKPGGYLAGTFPIPGKSHAADDPTVTFLSKEEIKAMQHRLDASKSRGALRTLNEPHQYMLHLLCYKEALYFL